MSARLSFMKQAGPVVIGFVVLAFALALRAGWSTWGRESDALLSAAQAAAFTASNPLPAPLWNGSIVLYAVLAASAVLAFGKLVAGFVAPLRAIVAARRHHRPVLGEAGQAMTEFAISFPVVLITTLILMQLALMYQAKNVVTYAAFAAARAAVVYIPAEYGGEGKHSINLDGGEKLDKVNQAAAMACIPIAPRASVVADGIPFVGSLIATAFSAFSQMMSALGLAGEYVDAALQRYAMSMLTTEVTLYKADENGFEEQSGNVSWDWPNESDVGVRVRHRYYLPIPLVNRFIGDDWPLISIPPFFSLNMPGKYTWIRSVAVLPLEGETGNPPITGFWDF